jgi:hypothetical protein
LNQTADVLAERSPPELHRINEREGYGEGNKPAQHPGSLFVFRLRHVIDVLPDPAEHAKDDGRLKDKPHRYLRRASLTLTRRHHPAVALPRCMRRLIS